MRACARVLANRALPGSAPRMAQTQPPPEDLLRHAVELHQAGDIAGAIADYRAYLEQAPENVMARSNLGAALSKAGQYEEAIVEYRQALDLEPRNLPVRLNLALAYYKTSQISAAAEELARWSGSSRRTGRRSSCWPIATCVSARTKRSSSCSLRWKSNRPTTKPSSTCWARP